MKVSAVSNAKKSRTKIHKNVVKWTDIIESIPEAVVILNLEGKIVQVNRNAEKLTGYETDELEESKLTKLVVEEDKPKVLASIKKVVQKGEDFDLEMTGLTKQGRKYSVSVSATLLKGVKGKPISMVYIVRDFTERKRAEEELEKRTHDLGERLKELNCFYGISRLAGKQNISLKEILQGTVDLIPPSWQYPEITCARVVLEGQTFRTNNFKETTWKQSCDIVMHGKRAGTLEVFYLEEKPEREEGPFLKEERDLIKAISERLGSITERKRVEEKIQQQNEFLNNTIESLAHPFYVIDVNDYTIKMANSAACLGSLSKESTCYALTHKRRKPCVSAEHLCPLEEVKKTKKPVVVEHIHYDKDGNARNVEVHGYPIFDNQGNVVQMIEYCLDITERKRAEEEISKFKTISDIACYGTAISDLEGNLLYVNEAFAQMHGYMPEDLIGKNLSIFHTEEQMKNVIRLNECLKKEGSYTAEEVWHKRKDGTVFPTLMSATFIESEKRRPLFLSAIAVDITERKKAEEELKFSRAYLQSIFDSSLDAIMVVDQDGKFISVNRGTERLTGYKAKELIGKPATKIVAKKDWTLTREKIKETAVKGYIESFEIVFLAKDGKEIPVNFSSSTVADATGRIIGLLGTARDITERKKAEEKINEKNLQLQRINKELEDFTYIVSHDLKSPLLNVQGFSAKLSEICGETKKQLKELSRLGEDLNSKQAKDKITGILEKLENNVPLSLEFIKASVSKMDSLIKSVLNLSRISTKRKPFELVDLNFMLKDIISSFEYQIQKKEIEVKVLKLPEVYCEKERINQVFSNLLNNAINYSGENPHPKIEVGCEDKGESFQFYVKDNGIGIEENYLDKIFQLFKRVGEVEVKGDGMGLAYVKKIIEQHQGEIWVKSEKGKGSTFYFTLPKKEVKEDARKEICEYTHSGG